MERDRHLQLQAQHKPADMMSSCERGTPGEDSKSGLLGVGGGGVRQCVEQLLEGGDWAGRGTWSGSEV